MSSERLNKVLAIGSTDALFSFLADWPKDELRALLDDVDSFGKEQEQNIEKGINVALFEKGYFLSNKATKMTMERAQKARDHLVGVLSEICSVALLYLGDYVGADIRLGWEDLHDSEDQESVLSGMTPFILSTKEPEFMTKIAVSPMTVKEMLDRFYRKCVSLSLSRVEIATELRKLADELTEPKREGTR